nr:immunoglobulin light chain junction region [Macaca mulatta]
WQQHSNWPQLTV